MAQVNSGAGDAARRLFGGYDSVAHGMLPTRIVEGETLTDGLPVSMRIEVCQSSEQLARALEIDASVSVSFLKGFRATAKMNFMNSLNVTENNLTIVAHVRNGLGHYKVLTAALVPGVKPPANDAEAADFVRNHGDSYISETYEGGEYYAVYTFRTRSRSERSNLVASLRASGISGGLTFTAETQLKLSQFSERTEVQWTFSQEMTGVRGVQLPDPPGMIDFARRFSAMEMNAPVMTGFKVEGYERIPGFGRGFAKVTANRRYFTDTPGILTNLPHLGSVKEQIGLLGEVYEVYGFEDPKLDEFGGRVAADEATVAAQVHAWEENPTGDFKAPELPSVAEGQPVLAFDEPQPASFGSDTGPNFDFMPVGKAFHDRVRIESIRLAPGRWDKYDVIRRIEIGYTSRTGKWKTTHGTEGSPGAQFDLGDGQFLSKFRIGHGGLIDSIVAHSGRRSIAAGGTGGTVEDWEPEPGAVVLGFAGRAGGALDQIRIVHAALKPARYM